MRKEDLILKNHYYCGMKADQGKYWTAFYTKPRNEKKVAERLSSIGFEIYCPQRSVLKQWSDRKKKVKEVLFTSYVFAHITEYERQEILKDQGVVSSVFWLKKPVQIPYSEIDAIKKFLDSHPEAEILEKIELGQKTMIKSGPFSGEQGIIEQIKGSKVVLALDTLGVTLHAEIPSTHLI